MAKLSHTELQPQSRDHLRLQARLRVLLTNTGNHVGAQPVGAKSVQTQKRTSKHKNLLRFCFTPSKLNIAKNRALSHSVDPCGVKIPGYREARKHLAADEC